VFLQDNASVPMAERSLPSRRIASSVPREGDAQAQPGKSHQDREAAVPTGGSAAAPAQPQK
jgi:hypothetical protein